MRHRVASVIAELLVMPPPDCHIVVSLCSLMPSAATSLVASVNLVKWSIGSKNMKRSNLGSEGQRSHEAGGTWRRHHSRPLGVFLVYWLYIKSAEIITTLMTLTLLTTIIHTYYGINTNLSSLQIIS